MLTECSPPTKCHMSGVRCQVSCVRCQVSHVTCHLSLTGTATATDRTLPLLTPPLCTVSWFAKTQKPKQISEHKKSSKRQKTKNVERYANISDTPFNQKSPVHREAGFRHGTDTHTHRHTTHGHRGLETVKMGTSLTG